MRMFNKERENFIITKGKEIEWFQCVRRFVNLFIFAPQSM